MTKQALPAVSDLTKDTLEEFKTADKVVLVGYFAADDKESNETFTAVANGLRDNFLFGAINDAAVAEAEGVKQPSIVLYKTFDEGKNTFTDKFDKEAIETFAKVSATPLIGEVGPETYSGYIGVSPSVPLPCMLPLTHSPVRPPPGLHLRRDAGGARRLRQGAEAPRPEAQGRH